MDKQSVDDMNSSWWLNENAIFDHSLKITNDIVLMKIKELFALLVPNCGGLKKFNDKLNDFNILCANLLVNGRRNPSAISRNRNNYTRGRYTGASYFTVEVMDIMRNIGWVEIKMGFRAHAESKLTRIWPTQEFLAYFDETVEIDFNPIELVNLKDNKHQLIDYKDTRETNNMRQILRRANIVNRTARVELPTGRGLKKLNTDLYAVFNCNWDEGGRLYNRVGYQQLRGAERKNIIINGEKTVELDFEGMQPRLLYASVGKQYDGDPYSAVDDNPELRRFLKIILLALINTDSKIKAVSSGNQYLHENPEMAEIVKDGDSRIVKRLVTRFRRAHEPIEHLFFQRIGLKLMRQDARIALDVVERFTNQGKPILAIHDSFIVQKSFEDELRETMQEAYKKYTDGFSCPIK